MLTLKDIRVRLKPVVVAVPHYRYRIGSVCAPDVEGTPEYTPLSREHLKGLSETIVEELKQKIGGEAVVEKPFIIGHPADFNGLYEELTYNIDAIIVYLINCMRPDVFALARFRKPLFFIGYGYWGIRDYIGYKHVYLVRNSEELKPYLRALRAKKYLERSKFLYFGEIPSFSAASSMWDFRNIEEKTGLRARQIEIGDLLETYRKVDEKKAEKVLEEWYKGFEKIVEPTREHLIKAVKLYLTIEEWLNREGANAYTVNCGRLTEKEPIVPCLPMAQHIDKGIMASCEGDISALISMMILHAISGKPVLMGNLNIKGEDEIEITHDVIPPSMGTRKLTVRDYHGRKFGVTGYTPLEKTEVTILRISRNLDKLGVITGKIIDSYDKTHCRISIRIKVKSTQNIYSKAFGHHHALVYGNYLKELEAYTQLTETQLIKLND
ncbi:MAG TPA: hypothetical protein ENF87_01275 [Thermoproteales archaeon]|nr:hypothetical protein [Thermoproteales archaeon]